MGKERVMSVDIGTSKTKVVVGNHSKNKLMIDAMYEIETPRESVQDGKILDAYRLRGMLSHIITTHKIREKKVICTLQSTSLITREVVLPAVDSAELKSMIQFEIEQYFPVNLEDYVVEYKMLEEYKENEVKKARILVAALPKIIVEDYLHMFQEQKLKPIALDINANAVSKLFSGTVAINDENSSLDKTVAVIDFGCENIHINIISNGILQFNRIIPIGGKQIDIMIADSLNLPLHEAVQRKHMYQMEEVENQSLLSNSLDSIIKTSLDSWIQEIQRLFQYYNTRSMGNRIDIIYIYGGGSNLHGIDKYLELSLRIPTYRIQRLGNVIMTNKNGKNDPVSIENFLNAIGAIIRR
ncbi:MAG: type IV pilus assembly protein PilM [Bacillota bacterium]